MELIEVEKAAKKLIENKSAEIVVVSLGAEGAILVTKDETHLVKAPKVEKKSTVGAGDSMVGGMVWALSQNKSLKEVIQIGVCCGTAATMNEGTPVSYTHLDVYKRQISDDNPSEMSIIDVGFNSNFSNNSLIS